MALSNSMTKLLDKIERRLGTKTINLPKELCKDEWANVVIEDTLETFSRYFPYKILYRVDTQKDMAKNGYYYIDENIIPGDIKIYGLKDISFDSFANASPVQGPNDIYDIYQSYYGMEEMVDAQIRADSRSMFNSGIYAYFEFPNKIAIKDATGSNIVKSMPNFSVYLFIQHADNLATIAPTKMEAFEKLAIIDVKDFLYQNLKHFDNLETIFGTVDLKIDNWSGAADDRDALIEKWNDGFVSASNSEQPIMYCV